MNTKYILRIIEMLLYLRRMKEEPESIYLSIDKTSWSYSYDKVEGE